MADPYKHVGGDARSFGRRGSVITPGSSDLPDVVKGVFVLATGNVTFVPVADVDGTTAVKASGVINTSLIHRP
jgi:hypothetical protein